MERGQRVCDSSWDYYNADYWIEEPDIVDACAYAASAGIAGSDVESGPLMCPTYSLSEATDSCTARGDCQAQIAIEGADITRIVATYASCTERNDSWVCDCTAPNNSMTITLSAEDGSSAMCVDALYWCAGEVTREGERTCEPSSQYAGEDYCYVDLLCTQDAVVGDLPATLGDSSGLSCQQDESGAWDCFCGGADSLEVEAETAWDACTVAVSQCTP